MRTDIIIPIWNRPTETRQCLVSLMQTAPESRLIFVDNASDRETEVLLEEFSDILGERALLVRNERNLGTVEGIVKGLAHAAAPFVVVVHPSACGSGEWLHHLLEAAERNPDAGIIIPKLLPEKARRRDRASLAVVETIAASFDALLLRHDVIDRVGVPNPSLDNGAWCLIDYCRRALRAGFRTIRVDGDPVVVQPGPPLGSPQRRERMLSESREYCRRVWGDDRDFVVHFPKETTVDLFMDRYRVILEAARRGDRFTIVLPASLHRSVMASGSIHHDAIRYVPYRSLIMAGTAAGKAVRRAMDEAEATAVSGVDGVSLPADIPAADFETVEQHLAQKLKLESEVKDA